METKAIHAAGTPRLFDGERLLTAAGLLGFALAAFCAVWVVIRGISPEPAGDMMRAFSFNAALGVFLLTTAAIIPLSGWRPRTRAWFRWAYTLLALYAYGVETVQRLRGVDPRFPATGSAFDNTAGSVFAAVAGLLVLLYLALATPYFFRRALERRPHVVLGIRYAMVAVLLSFAAGIWISVTQSRYTGDHGNIIWLHGLGFHALQAIPIAGWLAERTTLPENGKRLYVHTAGLLFLAGLACVGRQTMLGGAMLELAPLPVAAGLLFLLGIVLTLALLRKALSPEAAVVPQTYQPQRHARQ